MVCISTHGIRPMSAANIRTQARDAGPAIGCSYPGFTHDAMLMMKHSNTELAGDHLAQGLAEQVLGVGVVELDGADAAVVEEVPDHLLRAAVHLRPLRLGSELLRLHPVVIHPVSVQGRTYNEAEGCISALAVSSSAYIHSLGT